MWWRTAPADLGRAEDRLSTIYVERAHLDREHNAVTIEQGDRVVHLPAAMVATVLLGPGTTITHAAVVLLADSGTSICWVGEHAVRLYAHGLGLARQTSLLLRQAWLVSDSRRRVGVARRMYAARFPGEDVSRLTMQQLRGREGARVRACYREHSQRSGVPWTGRSYRPGEPFVFGDDVNRNLSTGNACLYGLVYSGVVSLGASPGLGFIHTGHAQAFVHDIADLYKATTTIPTAFDVAALGGGERAVRTRLRDRFAEHKLLPQVVHDVRRLLSDDGGVPVPDLAEDKGPALWSGEMDAVVPGGVDYVDPSL